MHPTFQNNRNFVPQIINGANVDDRGTRQTSLWLHSVSASCSINSWGGSYSLLTLPEATSTPTLTCKAEPPTYLDKNVGLAGVWRRFWQIYNNAAVSLLTLCCQIMMSNSVAVCRHTLRESGTPQLIMFRQGTVCNPLKSLEYCFFAGLICINQNEI